MIKPADATGPQRLSAQRWSAEADPEVMQRAQPASAGRPSRGPACILTSAQVPLGPSL